MALGVGLGSGVGEPDVTGEAKADDVPWPVGDDEPCGMQLGVAVGVGVAVAVAVLVAVAVAVAVLVAVAVAVAVLVGVDVMVVSTLGVAVLVAVAVAVAVEVAVAVAVAVLVGVAVGEQNTNGTSVLVDVGVGNGVRVGVLVGRVVMSLTGTWYELPWITVDRMPAVPASSAPPTSTEPTVHAVMRPVLIFKIPPQRTRLFVAKPIAQFGIRAEISRHFRDH